MVSQGIKSLTIQCGIFCITLDEEAIRTLIEQLTGDVTITVIPYRVSGMAASITGNRPVFDTTFKDSNGKEISSFGSGTVTRRIKYTPAPGENTGNLSIVKITAGGVEWIENSGYENGWMTWSGNSNSAYGVGYKISASFTDTETTGARNTSTLW